MSDNTKQKPGYKKTALGWIPEEWEVSTLGENIDLLTGYAFKSEDFFSNGIRLVRGSNVKRNEIDWDESITRFWEQEDPKLEKFKLQVGDIVVALDGALVGRSFAQVTKQDLPSYVVQRVARLRGKGVDQNFLLYVFADNRFLIHVDSVKTHTAIPHISPKDIREYPIPIPPLPEQRAIAGVFGCWDKAIGTLSALIAQKQARKKWIMQVLLTGKRRLPGFSDGSEHGEGAWRTVRLGDVGDFSKGSGVTKDQRVAEGLPCIRYGEIYTVHDIQILKFHSFISAETAMAAKQIQHGDIIFAGSGETAEDIGKCVAYLFDEEAYAGGDTIILRPHEGYDSLFLGYLLNGEDARREKSSLGKGNSVVHLYPKDLMEVSFQMPDFPEQKAIAKVLATCDRELRLLDDEMDVLKVQKRGLMQELLTGRKRLVTENQDGQSEK